MASSTVENYLKAILKLQDVDGESVSVGDIAQELEVTPGTVTTMMRHLSDEGMIDYIPRRGLRLLPKGREEALRVVRRHRLIESFLVEVMHLDWSEVHAEAEVLEHVVSDRLLDRMDSMLGHPTHDPHGHPIPGKDGRVEVSSGVALAEAGAGKYRVAEVSDQDSALLEWLNQKGVSIGTKFTLLLPDLAGGILEIQNEKGENLQIGLSVAERVFVERCQ